MPFLDGRRLHQMGEVFPPVQTFRENDPQQPKTGSKPWSRASLRRDFMLTGGELALGGQESSGQNGLGAEDSPPETSGHIRPLRQHRPASDAYLSIGFLWHSCREDNRIKHVWQAHVSPAVIRRTELFGWTPVEALTELGLAARQRRGGKRKALESLHGYIAKRQEMTDYPRFLEDGLQIGSGPTESQCKCLTARLKGRGRRWNRQASTRTWLSTVSIKTPNNGRPTGATQRCPKTCTDTR
jgi:hypothetical protein